MISKQELRQVEQTVRQWGEPVLTMYAHVNPASTNNHPKAIALRAKETLRALEVPEKVGDQVMRHLGDNVQQAQTQAIFASPNDIRVVDLHVELPIVDSRTGHVEARWGEPYTTPLLFAMDDYERYAVLYIDKDRWRLFEVFLGEIVEIADAFRDLIPEELDRLQAPHRMSPNYIAERGSSARDDADRRKQAYVHRFFKSAAEQLEHAMNARGMGRVILVGPHEKTRWFEAHLSRALQHRLVAHVPSLSTNQANAAQVLRHVAPTIDEAEAHAERELLDRIREDGVRGFENCLREIGRLYVLAVPWDADRKVFIAPHSGFVAATAEEVRQQQPSNAPIEERQLRHVLPDLAERYGLRLEFMRGDREQRLVDEFGGLGGLARY